ncbi:N-acetylmuramoyl-L-alanine amidase [Devosia sp.]|uniref:N-acetylmuramoyl-L-alanine amidase n=1 Tax=Devosia sp. TaxID=1871048 RepID=UPI003A8E5AA6
MIFSPAAPRDTSAAVRVLFAALMVLLFGAPAMAQLDTIEDYPDVIDARVTSTPDRARLVIDLSGPTEFAIVSLREPDRIAVDVKAWQVNISVPADVAGTGLISSFSITMAEKGRARTELKLGKPGQVQQAYVLDAVDDQPARLVVDMIGDTEENFAARVAADAMAARQRAEAEAAASKPALATGNSDPGTRPLVVIDPGHGGIDNGASAPNGVREKAITLAFALDLQRVLIDTGHFDVALTREDDTYLTLNERVALARQNKADLFISLHADSFQEEEIRGASVYTRDEKATDILDKVLAEGENKFDMVAGFALPNGPPEVSSILLDLMRREMRKSSFLAAQAIVKRLGPAVRLRRFPVRQADFFVLQAPDVPSVLIELGFLSNASDIANLQRSDWREKAVSALAEGISDYFDAARQTAAAE